MKQFASNEFLSDRERSQMVMVMLVFCSGFLIQFTKNLISYFSNNTDYKFNIKDTNGNYICTHNTIVNLFQFGTYIFEDLLPISVMLWMHHKNFRTNGQ
jgi:hypothetical protein